MARFIINYTFHGRSSKTIEASSKEEAEELTWAEVERDDFEIDADEIDYVDFTVSELHPVTRDGREIWTNYVRDSDRRGHPSALASSPLFGGA
ncbi:hypothetical protein N7376_15690 [Brucella intermedia GD04153]|uniref:Uncharacterized protein n=1 Tax=Brucella intermedia GD04153 TaxID=2975438 RepID=A0AA42H000_9HYPH|nr:hypothetical protein [Brucella intermedia]MDH0125450.1 hypothetical protein [Brucella intermedia GD04153]